MKKVSFLILMCWMMALFMAGCGGKADEITVPVTTPGTAVTTEAPVTEAPATETPVTEAPVTEAFTTEAPATETPATEASTTEAPATETPVTEASTTEAPATEVPPTEAGSGISSVAGHYADYLQTHWDILDMTRHYDPSRHDVCASYRNVAFFDVTGDDVPEMLLIAYDTENPNKVMNFRIITADSRGAREILKPNGDKIMNLFWDQTFVHDMTDTVLFAIGPTLYFYRKSSGGERDYSFRSEEIGRLTSYGETGSLYWEIALEWSEELSPSGTKILIQAEEKDVDEATYRDRKAALLGAADTFVICGMPYYGETSSAGEMDAEESDYISVTPSEALSYLTAVAEAPAPEPPATEVPTAEARTGLAAAAEYYADYLRTHGDIVDLTQQFPLYRDAAAVYPNVAFYDLTGDDVPEMLLICLTHTEYLDYMSFRVITADRSGAREITKPNGDAIMNTFWDQTMAGGRSDTVLFAVDSTLYFYRISMGDGLGYASEEIGRLVRDGGNLYWEIALEYSWTVNDDHTESYKYQAEEQDIDRETYYSLKQSLFDSAEEYIIYGMPAMMRPPANEEVNADLSVYISMTLPEALEHLDGLR